MVQGSLNPNVTFLGENCDQQLENKNLLVLSESEFIHGMTIVMVREKIGNSNKKRRNDNFEKQKKTYFVLISQG